MILVATSLMAFQDALIKAMSTDLPLWQLFLIRSAIALPVLLVLSRNQIGELIKALMMPWLMVRSLLIVAMYVAFYAAMPAVELPIVAACYYTGPVMIVILSAVFLRDLIRPAQVLAVVLAFSGVLIVLRPTGDAFTPAALVPLISALCYAIAAVLTKANATEASPWALTVSVNLAFVLIGATGVGLLTIISPEPSYPFLLENWVSVSNETVGNLILLAAVSVAIHLGLARAYQVGPIGTVASLDYAYLIFAAIWGFVFFGTVPDNLVIIGTALIAAAGLWATVAKPYSSQRA